MKSEVDVSAESLQGFFLANTPNESIHLGILCHDAYSPQLERYVHKGSGEEKLYVFARPDITGHKMAILPGYKCHVFIAKQ